MLLRKPCIIEKGRRDFSTNGPADVCEQEVSESFRAYLQNAQLHIR